MGIAPRAEGNFNARQVPPFGSWLNASKPAPSPELATISVDLSGPHSLPVTGKATAVAGRALESLATPSRLFSLPVPIPRSKTGCW